MSRDVAPAHVVSTLREAGLGQREAEVYVAREITGAGRKEAADALGYESLSSMDSTHQNAKKKVGEIAEAIRAVDVDENRADTLEQLVERFCQRRPDKAQFARQLLTAQDQKKALKLEQWGNSHAVLFAAEDGSIAIGKKTGAEWSAFAYADIWTASIMLQSEFVSAEEAELVDVGETRLFAAGQFEIHRTLESSRPEE